MPPVWKKRLRSPGVGGVAATAKYVIVSAREASNTLDGFRCFNSIDGGEVWKLTYEARGDLDYGNSPRATPQIDHEFVFLLGAFGHLHCVNLNNGNVVWKKDLRNEFSVTSKMVWGHASSPLVAGDKLIVNPGGAEASIVALEPATGKVIWKTRGGAAAYASFIVAQIAGRPQIIGYDAESLFGLDPVDGRQIWRHVPKHSGDFNVPTPVLWRDRLIVATENNGTRLFGFDSDGRLNNQPLALNEDLVPDTQTPVVVGNRLFGVWDSLHCLDIERGLKPVWSGDSLTYQHYTTLIASDNRLLISGIHGELILIDPLADEYREISRVQAVEDDSGVFAHPAIVGDRIYVRTSTDVRCLALA
jgi:outer membrane protein assembly factor BamB